MACSLLTQDAGTPKPPEAKKAKKPAWRYVDLPIASITPSATKKDIVDLREIEVYEHYVLAIAVDFPQCLSSVQSVCNHGVLEYIVHTCVLVVVNLHFE